MKAAASAAMAKNFEAVISKWPKKDFATFKKEYVGMLEKDPIMQNSATIKMVKDTDREICLNVTECLWANTFRQAQAADLGYAMCCHPDFAVPSLVSPKLKLIRTNTIMQGHDSCYHRYVWEG